MLMGSVIHEALRLGERPMSPVCVWCVCVCVVCLCVCLFLRGRLTVKLNAQNEFSYRIKEGLIVLESKSIAFWMSDMAWACF